MAKAITADMTKAADTMFKQENPVSAIDKIEIPKDILPEEKRVQSEYNVLFKLVKKRKGRTWLDNCCDNVPNPKNNDIPERIWLLNGATSIWESELENIFKSKDRYERSRKGRDIVFVDGVLRVRSSDKLMLEFLRKSKHNVGSNRAGAGKFDFYEYDPQQEQKDRLAKQMIKLEMIVKLKDVDEVKVKQLASFFGIPFVDELGMPKTIEGIRTELMLLADTRPADIQKHFDSKEVTISYMVKTAIRDAKIDTHDGNAYWAGGGGFICKIPLGRKPYEYLTELAMTNSQDGMIFKSQLEGLL